MFKKGKGLSVVETIAVIAIGSIITTYAIVSLNKNSVADDANKFQTELVQTVNTLSAKAVKNETADTTYNLGTIINEKGVFSTVQKKNLKKVGNKKVDTKVSGIVTYNGGDTLDLADGIDAAGDSLTTTAVKNALDPNAVGVLLGTSWDLTDYCDTYGVSASDGVLTVKDTKDNSDGTNDPEENICRGVLDGDAKSSIIYVTKDDKDAKKMNTEYFDNLAKLITITGTAGSFSGVVVPAK